MLCVEYVLLFLSSSPSLCIDAGEADVAAAGVGKLCSCANVSPHFILVIGQLFTSSHS